MEGGDGEWGQGIEDGGDGGWGREIEDGERGIEDGEGVEDGEGDGGWGRGWRMVVEEGAILGWEGVQRLRHRAEPPVCNGCSITFRLMLTWRSRLSRTPGSTEEKLWTWDSSRANPTLPAETLLFPQGPAELISR